MANAEEVFDAPDRIIRRMNEVIDDLMELNEKTTNEHATAALERAIKFLNLHKEQFRAFGDWLSNGNADEAASELQALQVQLGELVDASDPQDREGVLRQSIAVIEALCETVNGESQREPKGSDHDAAS